MARDVFHTQFKAALIKDGWLITHDPLTFKISETRKIHIDLAAESTIAAERQNEKIAVEIKSFVSDSEVSDFHTALGQYLNYRQVLEEQEPERQIYLAVPEEAYQDFFQISFAQKSLQAHQVHLITYDPAKEVICQWIA
jgi:XisH protein